MTLPDLQVGDRVEVRRKFDAGWARGFEILALSDEGVRVRRLSDGEELPASFGPEDVRAETRKREMWWI